MQLAHAVAFALSLPEACEEPHHELRSFRVGKKIFATLTPDGRLLHVFVPAADVGAVVAAAPDAFEELWWGKRLAGVRIVLARADADTVRGLLVEAWRSRAPKRATAEFDAQGGAR